MRVNEYAIRTTLEGPFDVALSRVKLAFSDAGFTLVGETNFQERLLASLNRDVEPYVLLGFCDPDLAYRAIRVERDIGVLLPCNVLVHQVGMAIQVVALDPALIATVDNNADLELIAYEARAVIVDAIKKLSAPACLK